MAELQFTAGDEIYVTHHHPEFEEEGSFTELFRVDRITKNGVADIVHLTNLEGEMRDRWALTHYPTLPFPTEMEHRHGTVWVVEEMTRREPEPEPTPEEREELRALFAEHATDMEA